MYVGSAIDVGSSPEVEFDLVGVDDRGEQRFDLLSIRRRDVAIEVTLDALQIDRCWTTWVTSPIRGATTAPVFSVGARINREDWGLTWNMVLEVGGLLVSKEITLEIEVELIRQTA